MNNDNVNLTLQSADAIQFNAITASIQDYAIIMLDAEGIVRSWNAGAELLKGYRADQIIGKHFSKFYTAEEQAANKPSEILALAMQQGRHQTEGWRVRNDGTLFYARVVVTPIFSQHNDLTGFIKITNDISEHMENQRMLRENEQRFRLFMNAVKDYAMIILNAEGYVLNWNEGARNIKGYSEEEIMGKHISVFYPPDVAGRDHISNSLELAVKNGQFKEEGWRLRKDGSRFFAHVVISPFFDEEGTLQGFAKITRDITEQKESERKLRDFYSVVSHELRSPMTSIRGALGLLEGGLAGQLSEDGQIITSNARICCDRLIRLINDLLDLSKLKSGKFQIHKKLVSARDLVDEAVRSLTGLNFTKEVNVQIEKVSNESISVDPDRIMQVLVNLLSNSIKFSPVGSKIIVNVDDEITHLKFSVSDTGPGIPEEAGKKLFQMFHQIDSSDSRPQEGTGLGLAISKAIVEQHNGSIDFSSNAEGGTTFYFLLPKKS